MVVRFWRHRANLVRFGTAGIAVVALAVSACSSSSDNESSDQALPTTVEQPADESGVQSANQSEPQSKNGDLASDNDSVMEDSDLDLATLWDEVFQIAGLPGEQRTEAYEALSARVPGEFGNGLANLADARQESIVATFPTITDNGDGTASIEDCVVFTPPLLDGESSRHYSGTASQNGDGQWILVAVEQNRPRCVPARIADQALNDFSTANAVTAEANNPPNPDDPRLRRYTTGAVLEGMVETLTTNRDNGRVFVVATASSFDEIVSISSATEVGIRRCAEPSTDHGLFDSDGNRLSDLSPPPSTGSTIGVTYRLVLEDNTWKLSDFEEQTASSGPCTVGPTPLGLVSIGETG